MSCWLVTEEREEVYQISKNQFRFFPILESPKPDLNRGLDLRMKSHINEASYQFGALWCGIIPTLCLLYNSKAWFAASLKWKWNGFSDTALIKKWQYRKADFVIALTSHVCHFCFPSSTSSSLIQNSWFTHILWDTHVCHQTKTHNWASHLSWQWVWIRMRRGECHLLCMRFPFHLSIEQNLHF